MRQFMGDEAEELNKSRWAMINVWRPLAPVTRDALAITDAHSVPDDCLTEIMMYFGPSDSTATSSFPSARQTNHAERAYSNKFDNGAWEVLPPVPEDKYQWYYCLLYTSPSPRDGLLSRMPSSA